MDLELVYATFAAILPMVMSIVYSSLIYRRKAIQKGEPFAKEKFFGTLAIATIISLSNYFSGGVIIPTDNLVSLIEASTGAVVLAEIIVKLGCTYLSENQTAAGIVDAIYGYLIGTPIPVPGENILTSAPPPSPGIVTVTTTYPSGEVETASFPPEYLPDLDIGLTVLPSRIEGPSPLLAKLRILTSPRWGPNAPTRYVVQWYDGSPDSTGDILDGEAEVEHIYTYRKGSSKYFSKHYRPDVTVYDERGKSEGIPGLNEVSVDVFDAEAVAEARKDD